MRQRIDPMTQKIIHQTQKNIYPSYGAKHNGILQPVCGRGDEPLDEYAARYQKQLVSQPPLIQPKLAIGQPNEPFEQDADRVAHAAMAAPAPKMQLQPGDEEQEED